MIHKEGQRSREEKLRMYLRRRLTDSRQTIEDVRTNFAVSIDADPEAVNEWLDERPRVRLNDNNWFKK